MSLVIADFGVNGLFPSNVGGTGTNVKYFGRNAAFNAGATWTSPLTPSFFKPSGMLLVPGDNKLNGQEMEVVAVGDFNPFAAATSETVEVALYAVTGPTTANPVYTKIATTNTPAGVAYVPGVDGIYYNFKIKAKLFGSNNSGIVGGTQQVIVNNTVQQAEAALAASLTGIFFGANGSNTNPLNNGGNSGLWSGSAPFGLVVGVTFGASAAANTANLYQFQISA